MLINIVGKIKFPTKSKDWKSFEKSNQNENENNGDKAKVYF